MKPPCVQKVTAGTTMRKRGRRHERPKSESPAWRAAPEAVVRVGAQPGANFARLLSEPYVNV